MFRNRKDAAQQLSHHLNEYKEKPGTIVIGIPKGGVKSAYHVALALKLPLAVLISQKISLPFNPEAAIGAIAEDGSTYFTSYVSDNISEQQIHKSIEAQKQSIDHYIEVFRKGAAFPSIKAKTVILVDDGVATGATLFAAIKMCRNKSARKLIVAVPVASRETATYLEQAADEVIILEQPPFYFAVSQVYGHFPNLTDDRIADILEKWRKVNT